MTINKHVRIYCVECYAIRYAKRICILCVLFFIVDPDLDSVPSPEPPDEIPRIPPTVTPKEPDNETPTPTGSVSLHIIPTTSIPLTLPTVPLPSPPPTPTSDSHATAFSCSYEGKFYHEGQIWRPNPCTNCTCSSREIVCKLIEHCSSRKLLILPIKHHYKNY